jgi:hypothetical protein
MQHPKPVFLELSANADHYMGGWHTCRPLTYFNIPLGCEKHEISLFFANRRKIIVKPLSSSNQFKVNFFLNNITFLLIQIIYYMSKNTI